MNAVSAVDMVHQGVSCDKYTFLLSLMFYKEVMKQNKVDVAGMDALEAKLKERNVATASQRRGEDMTDSNETDILVSQIWKGTLW